MVGLDFGHWQNADCHQGSPATATADKTTAPTPFATLWIIFPQCLQFIAASSSNTGKVRRAKNLPADVLRLARRHICGHVCAKETCSALRTAKTVEAGVKS
jgi:hypothetical protein